MGNELPGFWFYAPSPAFNRFGKIQMTVLPNQAPPDIDFSSFDFTNLANSFLSDETPEPAVGEKYLVFFLGEEFYAIASRTIAEAAPYPSVVTLPGAPEWLLGIANLRGEIISVINLPALLNKTPRPVSAKSKIIVMRSQNFDGGLAFAADRLNEIIVLSEEKIEANEKSAMSYIFGKAFYKSNVLNLLDAKKIFSALII